MAFQIPLRRVDPGAAVVARALRFATPAVIGGASAPPEAQPSRQALPHLPASLGLPALLAGLRFWWRAGVHAGAAASLRIEEIRLFGGPADKTMPTVGTAMFHPDLDPPRFSPWISAPHFVAAGTPLAAFLGSAIDKRDKAAAKMISKAPKDVLAEGAAGTLTLRMRPRAPETEEPSGPAGNPRPASSDAPDSAPVKPDPAADLGKALDFLTTFGGLGLLSRRGLGSVNDEARTTLTFDGFAAHVSGLIAGAPKRGDRVATYPIFSRLARCVLLDLPDAQTGLKGLAKLADAVTPFARSERMDPEHVFSAQKEQKGRHPSPLHIHIQRLGQGHCAVLTYLPTANLTKADERIEAFLDDLAKAPHVITVAP